MAANIIYLDTIHENDKVVLNFRINPGGSTGPTQLTLLNGQNLLGGPHRLRVERVALSGTSGTNNTGWITFSSTASDRTGLIMPMNKDGAGYTDLDLRPYGGLKDPVIAGSDGSIYYRANTITATSGIIQGHLVCSKISPITTYKTGFLAHFDGTNGAVEGSDEVGPVAFTTWTNVSLATAAKKFGTAALNHSTLASSGSISTTVDTVAPISGSGSLTIEGWVYAATLTGSNTLLISPGGVNNGATIPLTITMDNTPQANVTTGTAGAPFAGTAPTTLPSTGAAQTIAAATWYHFALVKDGSTWTTYWDGTRLQTTTDTLNIQDIATVVIQFNSLNPDSLSLDEFRISRVARYSGATYTVPTAAFTVD